MNNNIKQNSIRAWWLASRPKTLTAAAVPVMIALAMAFRDQEQHINIIPALLCMLFAMVMQIEANFVNDYFDWRKGNDDEETRLGPLRACSQGWVTPRAMVIAMIITALCAGAVGLPLIWFGGWEMLLVGVACLVFCVLYTTVFSYLGMGDVLVLLFFGIIPVCLSYYLQTGTVTPQVSMLSIACGMVVDTLLVLNNYRDINNDRRDGKRTLIVMIGCRGGEMLYLLLGIIPMIITMCLAPSATRAYFLMLYFILHLHAYLRMRQLKGRELNRVLGLTARNIFLFGLLVTLIYIL